MATGTSSSSSLPADEEEDEILMLYGSESGWVEAKSHCDHLASLSSDLTHIPTPDTPCNRCQHPAENWLCLCCKEVLCSRFVNKHMLEHHKLTDHSLALSFSDLSVWCFSCNAYLDAQVIMPLRSVHFTAYVLKFNEPPPLRAVECVHITDNKADGSSTFGN
ncbi:histone deacetylase 6 [Solanum pennellii]|uniref:Histone deacetylase 6 n=1 Tax=Solanum pennellii TaxID=28526 RepID=A0ABM1HS15_SOLPN|nr:histone deacetylase 6 [Solanum pennellii]XP_027767995.1 histone deacetylase 6 [Solanum pennellii]